MEAAGIEPEYANPFKALTYGDPDKGAGAKSGALGGNPRDLPPKLVAIWDTLTDQQRQAILAALERERSGGPTT